MSPAAPHYRCLQPGEDSKDQAYVQQHSSAKAQWAGAGAALQLFVREQLHKYTQCMDLSRGIPVRVEHGKSEATPVHRSACARPQGGS